MKRKPSLTSIIQQLATVPSNIESLRYDPDTGEFEARFRAPEPKASSKAVVASSVPASLPKLISGTPFPDDQSPLNPLDLVLNPPPGLS